jgi:SAM-dependent methyltransferase
MDKASQRQRFDAIAPHRDAWKKRNWYYHRQLRELVSSMVLPGSTVLEIGCGTGDLIGHLLDVWQACNELRRIARPDTRIIITYFNYLWQPILLEGMP